jgi:hypothetical protein
MQALRRRRQADLSCMGAYVALPPRARLHGAAACMPVERQSAATSLKATSRKERQVPQGCQGGLRWLLLLSLAMLRTTAAS